MDTIQDMESWLARYPADRYPVQHATGQFRLGQLLTDAGQLAEAARALDIAVALFDHDGLSVEHAVATNARGAVFRLAGDLEPAADEFRRAATAFAAAKRPRDEGVALFNLGLVHRDAGDDSAAVGCFRQARGRFASDELPAEAAAAARELGAVLLTSGDLDAAVAELGAALRLAERAGDTPGLGAAANLLGLARLAADRPAEAVEAFRDAAAAHPRTVRPAEHAMAKANLALAYERVGAADHACLAAAQALGTPGVATPVRAQARGVIDRLGERPGAVLTVLDTEPRERWPGVVREELVRWCDAAADRRRAECGSWVAGQLARPAAAEDLAHIWLGGLLELPPTQMTDLIRATLEALADCMPADVESFRATVSRAVVRFPVPQWTRLAAAFNAVAASLGQEASWG